MGHLGVKVVSLQTCKFEIFLKGWCKLNIKITQRYTPVLFTGDGQNNRNFCERYTFLY